MESTSFLFVAHLFCRKTMGFIQIGGNDAPEQRSNAGPEPPQKAMTVPEELRGWEEKRERKGQGEVCETSEKVGWEFCWQWWPRLAIVSEWFLCFWWIPESWVEAKSWKIWWLCTERILDDWFDMCWWTEFGEPLDMEDSGRCRTI